MGVVFEVEREVSVDHGARELLRTQRGEALPHELKDDVLVGVVSCQDVLPVEHGRGTLGLLVGRLIEGLSGGF